MTAHIRTGDGLVPSGNKPLPEPMLTQLYATRHHIFIHFSKIWIKIQFLYKKINLEILSANQQPFCFGLSVLTLMVILKHSVWLDWDVILTFLNAPYHTEARVMPVIKKNINSFHAASFWGIIKISVHFLSFLNIMKAQVFEILPLERQGSVYPTCSQYHGCSWPGDARSSACICHLFVDKPWPKPMLTYCHLGLWEQISVKFYQNAKIFIQENAFHNVVWKMSAILSRPKWC